MIDKSIIYYFQTLTKEKLIRQKRWNVISYCCIEIKNTIKEFEYFKYECEHWINQFELHDNYIKILFTTQVDTNASYGGNWQSTTSYLALSESCVLNADEVTFSIFDYIESIEYSAFHEVCHLLFSDFCNHIETHRYLNLDIVECSEHKLINKLWNLHKNREGSISKLLKGL